MGTFSTHIDDILGRGALGVLERPRKYLEHRFGTLTVQERTFVHVGMELAQLPDFSATLTQEEFTSRLQPMETSPALLKRRQGPLSDEGKLLCQCKMGELCWLATASRPDICARLAQRTSKVSDLQGSDIYRINALIKNVKIDKSRTILKYASSSFPLFPAGPDRRGRPRSYGARLHTGTLSLEGWSDAAYGDLSQEENAVWAI